MGNGLWDYGQWRYGDGQKEGRQGGAKSIIIYLFPLQMSARRRERASASMATTHRVFFLYLLYIYNFQIHSTQKKGPFRHDRRRRRAVGRGRVLHVIGLLRGRRGEDPRPAVRGSHRPPPVPPGSRHRLVPADGGGKGRPRGGLRDPPGGGGALERAGPGGEVRGKSRHGRGEVGRGEPPRGRGDEGGADPGRLH